MKEKHLVIRHGGLVITNLTDKDKGQSSKPKGLNFKTLKLRAKTFF